MRDGSATQHSNERKVDWKGLGYLVSIVSVLLLGAVAWPKVNEPAWHIWVLSGGMVTSIAGMGMRYKAHLDQQRELRRVESKARHKD